MSARDIHPHCEASCTHQLVPDLGGVIVRDALMRLAAETRTEA